MNCRRCGAGVVADEDEQMCSLCLRETRRNRIPMTNLHDPAPPPAPAAASEPIIDPALHRLVDRYLARLDGIDLDRLGRQLHSAINVDRANPSAPDGFPTSTPGANPYVEPRPLRGGVRGEPCAVEEPPGHRCPHVFPCPEHDRAMKTTTVEAAVFAGRGPIDEYHRKVDAVLGYLADASGALAGAMTKLADLEQLQDDAGLQPGDPGCWAMERLGQWEEVHATVVIEGEPRRLGNWAYRFHREHGRLPTVAECKMRADGRKVMVKVGAR